MEISCYFIKVCKQVSMYIRRQLGVRQGHEQFLHLRIIYHVLVHYVLVHGRENWWCHGCRHRYCLDAISLL